MKERNTILKILLFLMLIASTANVNAEVKWTYIKNPKYKIELKNEYNKIPVKAKNIYDEYDLEIKIYGYNYYPNYAGLFNGKVIIESYKQSRLKTFYRRKGINNSYSIKKLSMNYSKLALIHELGHAYDYRRNYLSKTDEFKSIYKLEKSKFKKTSFYVYPMGKIKENIGNSMEYFASSFAAYVMAPNDLKKRCPKTYEYLKKEFE